MTEAAQDTKHGVSTSLGDFILRHQLQALSPQSVVDFGAGAGKNGRIVRDVLGNGVHIMAVEGSSRTTDMLSQESIYNEVHCALLQDWLNACNAKYDLAIFGDVLEHLTPKQIHEAINRCHSVFTHIIVVCPLYDIFQDDAHGNPLEVHKSYITEGFFDRYNVTAKHVIKQDEWTIMNICISTKSETRPLYRALTEKTFHLSMLALQPLGLARPLVDLLKRYGSKFKWLLRG